jgi:hypothetical protein
VLAVKKRFITMCRKIILLAIHPCFLLKSYWKVTHVMIFMTDFSGHIGDMYIVIVLRKVNHIMTHLKPRKLFSLVLNNHILSFLLFIYRQKKNNINTFHNKLLHDSNTKALHKKRKIQIKKSENLTVWRLKCYNLLHVSIARKYFT